MAQPTTPLGSSDLSQFIAEGYVFDISLDGRHGQTEGPAKRSLPEFALSHNPDVAYGAHDEEKWRASQTLRFAVVSCGLFWAVAAAAFFLLR